MPRKNKIIIRTGTGAPSASDFVTGEPAFDSSAGSLYIKNAAGTMAQITGGGGGSVPDPYDLGTYPLITISAQPAAATVNVGGSATFSVTATATLPTATISYQWQQSADAGSSWSNVSGATSSSYTLSSAQAGDANKRFRCRLSANLSLIFSASATLTVNTASFSAIQSGWTGSGTQASPLAPPGSFLSASLTAGVGGTLRITGTSYADSNIYIRVNGVTVYTDASNGATMNISTAISSGHVVLFYTDVNFFSNTRVWIQ